MTSIENHLMERLPSRDRKRLQALCRPVDLTLSEVLCERGASTRYVYFPITAFISLVTAIEGKPVLEVGMVGNEGMVGAQIALGVTSSPLHALVQGPGTAWRVATTEFRKELARSPVLQRDLNRYLYVTMDQLASSAACLRFHAIAPRLARWLLMTQDRAHSDRFYVTHAFLAFMLGVRREGITNAASALKRGGYIEYQRGEVTVLDRPGLEAAACVCYAEARQTYADLLG